MHWIEFYIHWATGLCTAPQAENVLEKVEFNSKSSLTLQERMKQVMQLIENAKSSIP